MALFAAVDPRECWESMKDEPGWIPEFLHCGSLDYRLEAFPVKTMSGAHHDIWIPVEWKSPLRFLNHAIYCMWHASLNQRLPDTLRTRYMRGRNYAAQMTFFMKSSSTGIRSALNYRRMKNLLAKTTHLIYPTLLVFL